MLPSRCAICALFAATLAACQVHAAPAGSPVAAYSRPAPPNGYASSRLDADQCFALLDASIQRAQQLPDPYRDTDNVDMVPSAQIVTLYGEVGPRPDARARLVSYLAHPNRKLPLAVLRFMASRPDEFRDELAAQLEAPFDLEHNRLRLAALEGLVGQHSPEIVARARRAAERLTVAGRVPFAEARILAAAGDRESLPLLERSMALCPAKEPPNDAPSHLFDRYNDCSELVVYLWALGASPERVDEVFAKRGPWQRARAMRGMKVVAPKKALPYLRRVLAAPQSNLPVVVAIGLAREFGLNTDPVILEHLRRFAKMDDHWTRGAIHALPDGDPLAEPLLLRAVDESPTASAHHVAELARRGSPAPAHLVLVAGRGGSNAESYLGENHPMPYQLRPLADPRVDGYLRALSAAPRAGLGTRVAAGLVLAQRGQPPSPLVAIVLRDLLAGGRAGYDVYEHAMAAAACVVAGGVDLSGAR